MRIQTRTLETYITFLPCLKERFHGIGACCSYHYELLHDSIDLYIFVGMKEQSAKVKSPKIDSFLLRSPLLHQPKRATGDVLPQNRNAL